MSMDSDALRAFLAVADSGSFSKAGQQLHLTQPAISKRVASLEQELNAPLFDRVGKRIQLTQAGLVLYPKAEQILSLLRETKQEMQDLSGNVCGELTIATSHHIGLHKLPPVLRQFSKRFPRVNLKIHFLDSEIALDQVQSGASELAVVTLPIGQVDNVQLKPLWKDPLVFVLPADSSGPDTVTLQDLALKPAILPDLNTYTGRLIKDCFDRHHLSITNHMATNYLETIKMMVSVGLGWSVLPQSMVDHHLKEVNVENIRLHRMLGIARHQKKHLSNAALAFCDQLGAAFEAP